MGSAEAAELAFWPRGANAALPEPGQLVKYDSGGAIDLSTDDAELVLAGKIGSGAFGTVYKARLGPPKSCEAVACKILTRGATISAQRQFLCEAVVLKRCNHPNIVRFISLTKLGKKHGNCAGSWALVEEIMKGGSLSHIICKQMSNPHHMIYSDLEAWHWAVDAASALAYLHDCCPAIIHRDVKSANLLLTPHEGRTVAKLSDFGLHVVTDADPKAIRAGYTTNLAAEFGTEFFIAKDERGLAYAPHYQRYGDKKRSAPNAYGLGGALQRQNMSDDLCTASEEAIRLALGNASAVLQRTTLGSPPLRRSFSEPVLDHECDTPRPQTAKELRRRIVNDAADASKETAKAAFWERRSQSCNFRMTQDASESDASSAVVGVFDLTGHTGSPLYMAPEVYCGELYNGAADVFGMGMVMYELFGRTMLLFSEINPNSRDAAAEVQGFARKVAGGYRPRRPDGICDEVWALITACWHQDPVARPSAQAVLEALHQARSSVLALDAMKSAQCKGCSIM